MINWGTGAEPVRQRFEVIDMMSRGFRTLFYESGDMTPFLGFDVTNGGVAAYILDEGEIRIHFSKYESEIYDRLAGMATREASISELSVLSDIV